MTTLALLAPESTNGAVGAGSNDMIARGGLEAGLRAVLRGDETFDQFAHRTRERWAQIAELLHGRWDVPTWYAVEDVRQDLLLAAWRYTWRFDRRRSRMSLEHFAVWNAVHAAIKAATTARLGHRPHRGEGRDVQSCYEIPVSALARDGEDDRDGSEMAHVPATQEDEVGKRLFFGRLAQKASGVERIVLCALAACGSADGAVSALYDDEDTRWLLRIGNEADAEAIVRATIEKSSRRVNMAEAIARQKRSRVSAA